MLSLLQPPILILLKKMPYYFIEHYEPGKNYFPVDVKEVEKMISNHIVGNFLVNNTVLAVGLFIVIMLLNITICPWIQELQAAGFSNLYSRLLG